MADKKNDCGCGCIPLKQKSPRVTKEDNKPNKPVKSK